MSEKPKKIIKCSGRFSQLREYLYNEAIPVVADARTTLSRSDLDDIWSLMSEEAMIFDRLDPYYDSTYDTLRKAPQKNALSLIPLIENPGYGFETLDTIKDYCTSMGNHPLIAEQLAAMGDHPRRFLQQSLGKEPKDIQIPIEKRKACNLGGYLISGNFGVGTISHGGTEGGGIRSDSPFLLEVYRQERESANLVSVIGFWAQDNKMLISQMQSSKNARFPEGVLFGVGSLRVAETVASAIGFDSLLLYSARGHPIFKEHPDSWSQFGKDFVCIWDNSAKKLGYTGSRNGSDYHSKKFSGH